MPIKNILYSIIFLGVLLSAIPSQARAPKLIRYMSGTGFFVTHAGHILTNNHVINKCNKISINGDGVSTSAKVVARDVTHDLALLKAAFTSSNMAYFNSMRQPVRANDPVVIIGYPGDSWRGHNPIVRASKIIDMRGPTGEKKWLQFHDSVERGNSGGPLLDSAGNVVGVVVAKSELRFRNKNNAVETIRKADLAISLPTIKRFLIQNNILYQTADSTIYLSPDRVNDRARPFIVNVHCVTSQK